MTGTGRYNSLLVTGGAGFIGSAFVCRAIGVGTNVAVLDALTYAGRTENLAPVLDNSRCGFVVGDICDPLIVEEVFSKFRPEAVVHFAAESHVDRSIEDPAAFIETNIHGTQVMLDAALRFFGGLSEKARDRFRFVHISTDEVFGSLGPSGAFDEDSAYAPRSPYSASKAAADHLAMAWHTTYGLPVSILHASNNYGPRQFPEKFIPNMIISAVRGRPLTVYGDGGHMRDWLHVDDTGAAPGAGVIASAGSPSGPISRLLRRLRACWTASRRRHRAAAIVTPSSMCPIVPDMTVVMRRILHACPGSSAGVRRVPSRQACARPLPGISKTNSGGVRSWRRTTRRNDGGWSGGDDRT